MEKIAFILLGLLMILIFMVDMMDKRKDKKELKELQNTPIEVYRYTYKVYLNDGSSYIRLANAFCSVDFDEFIERILLNDATLEITEDLVLNTENITKAELVSRETKTIRPKVNKCYGGFYLSKGYGIEEVLEREIKQ